VDTGNALATTDGVPALPDQLAVRLTLGSAVGGTIVKSERR